MMDPRPDSRTPTLSVWARWRAQELRLALHVQPSARRTAVIGEHGQRLKIALRAPPVEGKANEELLRFLAQQLGLRRNELRLSAGPASREKAVCIDCDAVAAERIVQRLAASTRERAADDR